MKGIPPALICSTFAAVNVEQRDVHAMVGKREAEGQPHMPASADDYDTPIWTHLEFLRERNLPFPSSRQPRSRRRDAVNIPQQY